MKYRWECPGDWLEEKISSEEDMNTLRSLAHSLANLLDSDAIQDEFQADMDQDGYFLPESEPPA